MVVMALDHVRDYFVMNAPEDPMQDPHLAPAMFLTRWVTHFCAPTFVFLAGTSAGLMTARRSRASLGRFLLTRGLWLIVVEIGIIATAATFAPEGIAEIGGLVGLPMQVIWAIGASMVALAAAQWLGRRACLVIGVAILVSHNLLDRVWPVTDLLDRQWPLWVALHAQMSVVAGPLLFVFIYPPLAWVGVMLAGFGASGVFERAPTDRNRTLAVAGATMVVLFLLLRAAQVYGDPNPWQVQPDGLAATVIDFLNTTKYPPSLEFLLMTLGPAALVCAAADRVTGPVKTALITFGRVPFAFYVVHMYLIHSLSVALGLMQGFHVRQMLTLFLFYPHGYGLGLPGVYAVWALVIAILYPFCRWMAALKARRKDWWLSYL